MIRINTALTVCSDMNKMRSKLTELGYDVPKRRYGFGDELQDNAGDDAEIPDRYENRNARGMSSPLALTASRFPLCLGGQELSNCQQSTRPMILHLRRESGRGINLRRS